MTRHILIITALFTAGLLLPGCGGGKVSRIDSDEAVDLSGEWNDTDSRLVAEEMIRDCMGRPWTEAYASAAKKPTIIVGTVRIKSHEHINVETFVNDMQRELINSGRVTFVASKTERNDLREEKMDQETYASEASKKRLGEEVGADLMLIGSINTIEDAIEGKRIMYYQTDLELIKVESNEKLWIGTKKIKKYITRKKYKM